MRCCARWNRPNAPASAITAGRPGCSSAWTSSTVFSCAGVDDAHVRYFHRENHQGSPMLKLSLLIAASVASVELISAKIDDGKMDKKAYTHEIESWRKQRVDRLKSPNGWLSLVGLF